jgi:hypothetical protein
MIYTEYNANDSKETATPANFYASREINSNRINKHFKSNNLSLQFRFIPKARTLRHETEFSYNTTVLWDTVSDE